MPKIVAKNKRKAFDEIKIDLNKFAYFVERTHIRFLQSLEDIGIHAFLWVVEKYILRVHHNCSSFDNFEIQSNL